MKTKEIKVGNRYRKDLGDLTSLKESIADIGLLHPIVVTGEGKVISGVRRLAAIKELEKEDRYKKDTVPVRVIKSLDEALPLLKAERDENTCRKDFLPTEALALGEKLHDIERAAAKERRAQSGGGKGKKQKTGSGKLPEPVKGDTRDKVGKAIGMSGKTYEKAKKVVAIAEDDPEMFGDLPEQMDKTGNVDKAFKQIKERKKKKLAREIRSKPPPIQKEDARYEVIVVDPPWHYKKRKDDTTHRGRLPYPSMTTEEICVWGKNLPTEKGCILWLWTTNAFMRDAFTVLDAWGFTEKTILTWVKNKMGLGDWLRGKTEHCILAVKGKPIVTLTNQTTVLEAPAREHSEKPDEFYDLVDVLCPSRQRAEYFARKERQGWDTYGAEVKYVP